MEPIRIIPIFGLACLFALASFAYAQEVDRLQAPISQRSISDKDLQAIAELHAAVESKDLKALKKCLDAGANDYMAKPIDVDKLLSLVRVWMPR